MTIEIKHVTDADEWNRYVEQSDQAVVYHRHGFLTAIAEHGGFQLHPLVGFKGQEPVGILPVFEVRKGPVTTVFSPPPNFAIPYLGPALLNDEKRKRRNLDRTNKRFIEGCLDYVETELSPKFVFFKTTCGYDDIRPFQWDEFDVEPRFTYHLDLDASPDTIRDRFTSSLRREISGSFDREFEIAERGEDGIDFVIEHVRNRYEAQGKNFDVTASFVKDVFDRLPDESTGTYICEVEGQPVSGKIYLQSEDNLFAWLGSGKPDVDFPVNEMTTWKQIREGIDDGCRRYDFNGADVERIAFFKAKFNPVLGQSYTIQKGTKSMNLVSEIYKRWQ